MSPVVFNPFTGNLDFVGSGGGGGGSGSTWYTGSGAPSAGLGVDGDFYLNSANGDYYQKISGAWSLQGNLQGPTGATGPTGPTGVVSATAPLSYNAGTQTVSISQATTSTNGYLSSTDWNTFNNKFPYPTGTTAQYIRGDGSLATFPTVFGEAQALVTEVYNKSGATITKGSVIYINGQHGNLPTIALAKADSDLTSSKTYGLVKTDISDNSNGWVVHIGLIGDLNTNSLTTGVALWLSPTTAGTYTTTKPSAPNHQVFIGICTRAHPTQGTIELFIQNGLELEELHDVAISSPSTGQTITYDLTTKLWSNHTLTKSDVGLSNVDNTSDLNKPISTATQSALNGKFDNPTGTTSQYIRGDGSLSTFASDAKTASVVNSLAGSQTDQAPSVSAVNTALASKQDTITGAVSTVTTSNLTASKAVVSDGSGKIAASATTATEIGYLSGVSSSVQTQINSKFATPTGTTSQYVRGDGTLSTFATDAKTAAVVNSLAGSQTDQAPSVSAVNNALSGKEPNLSKTNLTEATSSILTISNGTGAVIGSSPVTIQVKQASALQSGYLSSTDFSTFSGKQDAITGGASTVTSSNLTASRALVSDASGKIAVSSVTSTTLGYLDATSSVQTQINSVNSSLASKVDSSGLGLLTTSAPLSYTGLPYTIGATNLSISNASLSAPGAMTPDHWADLYQKVSPMEQDWSAKVTMGTSGWTTPTGFTFGTSGSISGNSFNGGTTIGKMPHNTCTSSSGIAGSVTGAYMAITTSYFAIGGGWRYSTVVSPSDGFLAGTRFFVGALTTNTNISTTTFTSTSNSLPLMNSMTNFFCFGYDSTSNYDSYYAIYHNGSTAGQTTRFPLASFPVAQTNGIYIVEFWNIPGTLNIIYKIKEITTQTQYEGQITGTTGNLPTTSPLWFRAHRTNGTTTNAVKFELGSLGIFSAC